MKLKNLSLTYSTKVFKALSEEPRVRIINLLHHHGEMCISDLEKILDFTQAKTSRHLIYLKNSGILNSRRYNHWVFYQIKEGVEDIIKQVFQFLRKDQQLLRDQQTYQTLFTNRELAVNKLQIQDWQRENEIVSQEDVQENV